MTTTSWTEIKARRADRDERRRGYERSGRAIRLASEIRDERAEHFATNSARNASA